MRARAPILYARTRTYSVCPHAHLFCMPARAPVLYARAGYRNECWCLSRVFKLRNINTPYQLVAECQLQLSATQDGPFSSSESNRTIVCTIVRTIVRANYLPQRTTGLGAMAPRAPRRAAPSPPEPFVIRFRPADRGFSVFTAAPPARIELATLALGIRLAKFRRATTPNLRKKLCT